MVKQSMTIQCMAKQLAANARISRQRRLLVISGSEQWCCIQAQLVLAALAPDSPLWVGSSCNTEVALDGVITSNQARQWLGRETDCLVINAWSGFDVDAFGALSGTLMAGGLLLLLTPPLQNWASYNDPENKRIVVYPDKPEEITGRYLKRLVTVITDNDLLSLVSEDGECCFQEDCIHANVLYRDEYGCCTEGQSKAVLAIRRVATGHRRRPLVLTADRGRGKSAALGIAAASLMKERPVKIIVTAPALIATDVIFHHAVASLGGAVEKKGVFCWQNCQLLFKAPDELVESQENCDLLLVDEAAAIPASLLANLLKAYSRIVFSSTIHGYEGTGRGFAVRFRKTLDQLTPQWKNLHVSGPIRWAEHDPLENFTFDALLLNASPVGEDVLATMEWRQWQFEELDRDQLQQDPSLLSELFGLLVFAHYKTSPFDLRHLLDGSNISVYCLRVKGHVLATALVAREGEIADDLIDGIWLGKRRIRGHLIPQSLSNHLGIPGAIAHKGARVLRIAVHPGCQRQGLGLALIKAISDDLYDKGVDYIGSLFGATSELLDFWCSAGLQAVRVGLTREAATGSYAAMVFKPLTNEGQQLLIESRRRFSEQIVYLLADGLQHLDVDIVVRLLKGLPRETLGEPNDDDWRDVASFAEGLRLYESCIAAIRKRVLLALSCNEIASGMDFSDQCLLIGKVLQNKSWAEIVKVTGLSGRNEAISQLRNVLNCLSRPE